MSKAFAELLQDAVDQGRIVLVPPRQHGVLGTLPSLRVDRDAAALTATLCVLFRLNNAQSLMLTELLRRDCCRREELRAVAAPNDKTSTIDVAIFALRKKLKPFNIKIITVRKIGYALDGKSRDRIYKFIAQHDADAVIVPTQTLKEADG